MGATLAKMRYHHFMPGELVALNDNISDAQAQGYHIACDDPRKHCSAEAVYEVVGVDVRRWATAIYLQGIDGKFNSVCFHNANS